MKIIDPSSLSDDDLSYYRECPKIIINPKTRWKDKLSKHRQRDFVAKSTDGIQYLIYCRKSITDPVDFSCGVILNCGRGKSITLVRYNGANHQHGNIRFQCHIHLATADNVRSMKKKDDAHATITTRYNNFDHAFSCLISDCGVQTEIFETMKGRL